MTCYIFQHQENAQNAQFHSSSILIVYNNLASQKLVYESIVSMKSKHKMTYIYNKEQY